MNSQLFISLVSLGLMSACTLSFQNIETHGTATDLIDETQAPSTDVKAPISIPVSPIPMVNNRITVKPRPQVRA